MALFAFATSGPSFAQQFTPRWVQASAANATINITISNIAGSTAAIKRIDFTKPSTVANLECGGDLPAGWDCTRSTSTVVQFSTSGSGIAAGSSAPFMINITPPAGGGNQTFVIDTYESAGGANANTSGTPTILNVNSSVDNDFPFVQLMNISARRSDGSRISINGAQTNGLFFLPNTSDGYVFVINASDNASGMDNGRVTLYYNISTNSAPNNIVNLIDYRNASLANVSNFQASNGSIGGPLSLYNVTLNISSMASINGTRIAFIILANDSVRNGNVSNSSASVAVSTYVYNFTIDAVAPQFNDVELSNGSQVNTNALNTTKTFGGFVEHIINGSVFLNLTVNVSDSGGSGTVLVEVLNRTGGYMKLDLLTGANASAGQTVWKINATTNVSGGNGNYNITDLIRGFSGDGQYNITFRATDNVSNQNATYNFTVEVDDSPPTAAVTSNISISGGLLSSGNATLSNATLNSTAFVLRIETVSNINNVTANISVWGQAGLVFNMTYEGGTPSGTSRWNLTIKNDTLSSANLSQFCVGNLAGDATSCSFRFNFTDVLGRHNDTLNLTVFIDSNAPSVFAVSPASITTNHSRTALVNFTVNDTVGLQNVSFRLRNVSIANTAEGAYGDTQSSFNNSNVTNWIPMSLGTGFSNRQPSNGSWNFTINLTTANLTDGTYIIEVNATDSAGRSNFSTNVSNVIFDSSVPTNISLAAPGTNSFHNSNFTVNANATELVSGLKNISFRLENSTHTFNWVPANSIPVTLGTVQFFNASYFNISHVGGLLDNLSTNATNGNFTLRLNVTDTAGNQNTTVTVNVTIDLIVPSVAFVYPLSGRNQSANFTVNITVTESNNNFVAYRWENHTGLTANEGQNFSNWITFFSNQGGPNNWNSTFNITEGTKLDGNYTIKINVTDKAGNQNVSEYVQLLLDQSRPEVVAAGSLANSVQTGNFVINMTTRDNRTFNQPLGLLNSSNINATAVRLENSTASYPYFNISFPSIDLGRSDSNRTNVTFTFASIANGNYDIRFWVNDTAGNQNNSVLIKNVTLDNVAPSVTFPESNVTPALSGGGSVAGNVTFNVTITDNLPLNISIVNLSSSQGTAYGVFYRFENSTYNGSWLPMSTRNFLNTVHNNTGNERVAIFNATNTTYVLADGPYKIRINVTDIANNQYVTATVDLTVLNGGSIMETRNETFLEGMWNSVANSSSGSYTFLVNTTVNGTCLYSFDTPKSSWNAMLPQTSANTMTNNVSTEHRISFGPLRDVGAGAATGHTLYYVCKDTLSNYSASQPGVNQLQFGIDTVPRWNVTIPGRTFGTAGNYMQPASGGNANGWVNFRIATVALSDTTLNSTTGGYNVTNVLSSLLQGTAAGNFTKIYAYNASTDTWQSFRVGRTGNSFINFSDESDYWINVTEIERIEIR